MKISKALRLLGLVVVCLILATGIGLQSASIAMIRKDPVTAISLFAQNGLAEERLAYQLYRASTSESGAAAVVPDEAQALAQSSYSNEPLTPDSHALLALSMGSQEAQSGFVALATQLNRRDQTLQGLALQRHVNANNVTQAIETLDAILRVRPTRSEELFPVLREVFSADGAVDEFAEVLDGTSPWHRRFINFALNDAGSLNNLRQLRQKRPFPDDEQDKALVRNLAQAGELRSAYALFEEVNGSGNPARSDGTLSWSSEFPPFEWQLANQANFRAQESLTSDALEVFIRPGQGGIMASRIIETPATPFSISLEHDLSSSDASNSLQLGVGCAGAGKLSMATNFDDTSAAIEVSNLPSACEFLLIVIRGRAWSGQTAIRGTISPITLR